MQSYDCHSRITNRIEELLDIQLQGLARTMIREHDCRNKLKTILSILAKQMRKQQIQIPFDKGRTMFGVVDETGQLQYGQIFAQYTENINLKTPPPNASRKILTGKVLLTKNPCIVPGDVRVFTAVDIPALHHLCDVVVFPIHGPRPHTDEMAGSDLDGDEYVVIWDKDLLLDRNEEPFDYTADNSEAKPIVEETLTDDMADFYVKYITQDSVGTISNSFLFQADLYGIKSEVCHRLAKKISQAVDFTKTGLPPEPLVKKWSIGINYINVFVFLRMAAIEIHIFFTDENTGKEIPPEKSERHPDFHFGNDRHPVYRSSRLLGMIYRQLQGIEDVLKISENMDEQDVVECDKFLIVDDWQLYKKVAEEQLSRYNGRLRALMENYGIKLEGELLSGCISEMRNRISDRDQDDMSFYNTAEVIEKKVTLIFREFREQFFEEFGGWQSCTEKIDKKFVEEENVLHRVTRRSTIEMQQKAVAYYRTCYDLAQQTGERLLSFAWIGYDILSVVRQNNMLKEPDITHSATPLCKILKQRIYDYCEKNKEKFISFMQFPNKTEYYPLQTYVSNYPGLEYVMFIICEWAERNKLLTDRLQRHHICLILVLYGIGRIAGSSNRNKPFLKKLELLQSMDLEPEKIDEESQIELLLSFFEYLASRAFRKLPFISFSELEYSAVFLRGEWLPMHEVAVRTYYNMVFNLEFEELNENRLTDSSLKLVVRECEPFVIELPGTVQSLSLRCLYDQNTFC
ncbi:RNA dependent RNA polymerase [Dictyocaulus viviparus]|uniref:RNA-dependent RNA polymerase n=1 Tax=Dictyocaulus viviparus TaxID=29172 RepID=A0A0D8XW11_DICVI|nr:RNA dependent RNA polymerase [Dictyocaulus viviparus]